LRPTVAIFVISRFRALGLRGIKRSIGGVGVSVSASSSGAQGISGQLFKSPAAKDDDMQKISPFLWFDNQAEEAMHFYVSIFKQSKVGHIVRYGDAGPGPNGSVMTASFELDGQQFTALNGGPRFKFTEAISFVVDCQDQAEVDDLWDRLSEGGEKGPCGWLKDKFGLSWQIVPSVLIELISDPDRQKSRRVMEAMLQMSKIDVAKLKAAHEG
jgi:predicted 3-demethylubiquinone-9 3-methyltransferase (glyoxalase superfamily)